MKQISFNEVRFENVQQKDIISFVEYVVSNFNHPLWHDRLSANDYSITRCLKNEKMCNVTITFQVWEKGVGGMGKKYEWNCYRAIDFGCSNISHKEVAFSIKEVAALASI